MEYEIAEVKKYTTTNKKTGVERTTFQIHIKKGSKFRVAKTIGLIDLPELEKLESFLKHNPIEEKEAEIIKLSEENLQLKKELEEANSIVESLTSDVEELKEDKIQLQEDVLTEKNNSKEYVEEANSIVIEVKDKLEKLQEEHNKEIKELNFQLNKEKDLTKSLLVVRSDFLKQNPFSRLFKVEPESSKRIAKLKELPEEVETNISED